MKQALKYILLIPIIIVLIPDQLYIGSLLISLGPIWLIYFSLLFLYFIIKKMYPIAIFFLLGTLSFYSIVAPINDKTIEFECNNSIKIIQANLLKNNIANTKALTGIKNKKADVICFQETTPRWIKAIEKDLIKDYPFQINYPLIGSFGISMVSKHPISKFEIIKLEGIPIIKATIKKENRHVQILSVHAPNPTYRNEFNRRNKFIDSLANIISKETNTPTIISGDFNTVPWDSNFKLLQTKGKVQSNYTHYQPTWPSWSPVKIPIDHMLSNNQVKLVAMRSFKIHQSDHLGLIGKFEF